VAKSSASGGAFVGLRWRFQSASGGGLDRPGQVQAAGAIIIIGATAWIANRSSREAQERERIAKQQLWGSITILARNCLDALDNLLRKYRPPPTSDPMGHFLRSYEPSDFEVPMDGLAGVPMHQVGEAALITAVLTLRGVMGRVKNHLDYVRGAPLVQINLEVVGSQRTLAFNAVASILRIVEGAKAEQEISHLASRS
jgi:hypothetical protein